jgi:hypothetical protein
MFPKLPVKIFQLVTTRMAQVTIDRLVGKQGFHP